MAGSFKIFISYRRKGGYDTAKLIYDRLRLDGYSVFFDIDTLENGNFDDTLEKRVKKCKDFILVLSPGVFDRFSESGYDAKDDWVRQEIICALGSEKNIVPLALEGFAYPKRLPNDIKEITRKNSIDLSPRHFESAYEKMKDFLLTKPYWKVRHKKQIRITIFLAFLALAIYLSFMAFNVYLKMKTNEAEIMANSAITVKDMEIARLRDSTNFAKEKEIIRLKDSINSAKDAEIAAIRDSMAMYKDLLEKAQEQAKEALQKQDAAKKTTSQSKSSTRKTSTAKGAK